MCEMAIKRQGKDLILQFPIADIIQMAQSDNLKIFHGERFKVSSAKECNSSESRSMNFPSIVDDRPQQYQSKQRAQQCRERRDRFREMINERERWK
jgi:hypothetical protein